MRWLAFVLACSSPPVASPAPAAGPATARFAGTVTDLDFGCWADHDCAIEVDHIWIEVPGDMRENPPPHGQVIGIAFSGEASAELKNKEIGRAVDVYAAKVPIYDAGGNVSGYDPHQLTLEGSRDYYVRAK